MSADTEVPKASPIDDDRIQAQLRRWQERLLDLTKANPLLGINRSRVSKLRVSEPNAETLFRRVVTEEAKLNLPLVRRNRRVGTSEPEAEEPPEEASYTIEPGDVEFDATALQLLSRLRRIFDNSRTTVEERGVTTLYLTFGVLEWDDPYLGSSLSPLWMVPCQLESFGPSAPLQLSLADEDMHLNPALELYLRERHRVDLPPLPEEPNESDLGRYLEAVRTAVSAHIWKAGAEVWFSTFTFESLVIYQDLKAMASTALRHAVVVALARASVPSEGSEKLGEESLDELSTPSTVPVSVLPSDSSQLKALVLATSGRHLVIHGPPGTGKSQTISNLIAEAIGRNKTVLFVSAKMAALSVVYERLAKLGMGRFCLEAHSTKAGKAKVIQELKRTLEAASPGDDGRFIEELDELVELRRKLNEYVTALHERRAPLDRSLYQVIGTVEKLRGVPQVHGPLPWGDPLAVTRRDLASAMDALRDLSAQARVFDARESHPWRGLSIGSGDGLRRDELEVLLRAARTSAQQISHEVEILASLLGSSLGELAAKAFVELAPVLSDVASISRLPNRWAVREPRDMARVSEVLVRAAQSATEYRSQKIEYDKVLRLPVIQGVELLLPAEREFSSATRYLRPDYWRWRAGVQRQLRPGARASYSSLRAYLLLGKRLLSLERWFQQESTVLSEEIGSAPVPDADVCQKAAIALTSVVRLREVLERAGWAAPNHTPSLTPEARQAASLMSSVIVSQDFGAALARLASCWPSGFCQRVSPEAASLSQIITRCDELLAALPQCHEWTVLQHTLRRCTELGLGPFVEGVGGVSASFAPDALDRRFHSAWATAVMDGSPSLATFAGVRREQQIERFQQLDESLRRSALKRDKVVGSEAARRIASAQGSVGHGSEVAVLRRELEKRRRIKPLRKLFSEIPHALQALKPCMLMSPLSVSTFLSPGALFFDLVIFDEASQLPTQQAIPAILRGRQVVVAGDANQLPPTAFFDAAVMFDDNDPARDASEGLEPLDSLLDDAVAVVPTFERAQLRWHYRSRDERLIKFSNHFFYDNLLITFPAVTSSPEGRGVRLEYVADGVWDRGRSRTNRREAKRVAALVIQELGRYPDRSLGVAALNVAQKEAIEQALDEILLDRPDVVPLLDKGRDEPFFIKALENVQGDERDTIIVSVGYAKTAEGSLSMNFGPINQDGGWRRLNVLVTRAKWQIILVTSIRSHELAGVNPSNRGATALRDFIAYAERRGELPPQPAVRTTGESNDFEDAVAEALRGRGLEIDQQVGASNYRIDLAVRDPRDRNRYLLGVECDGATYHSAKTARDRDLLRQLVLRDLGWRLHRVWSTEWFRSPEQALQKALASYELALRRPIDESVFGPQPSGPAPAKVETKPEDGREADAPTGYYPPVSVRRYRAGKAYEKYKEMGRWRGREYLLNPSSVHELAYQIVEVTRFEGPIHEEVLLDRLKEIHGIERAGANVQSNVDRAIERALLVEREHLERVDRVLRVPGRQLDTFRIPGDGVERPLTLISSEEIELGALFLIEDQFGFQRDALPQAINRLFGFDRTRVGTAEFVGNIVDGLVERGLLRVSGLNVYISGDRESEAGRG